jgi:hypothetical protein
LLIEKVTQLRPPLSEQCVKHLRLLGVGLALPEALRIFPHLSPT